MVTRKHKYIVEKMIEHFPQGSRLRLRAKNHPVWGGPGRKVFLEHPDDVRQTIRYVKDNPIKIGRPRREWGFVRSYDGWSLHPRNNPNSPYAKGLRAAGRYP